MPIGSTLEGQLLNAMLCGKAIANISATAGSSTLWVALHTADPSSGGGQGQSELALTGYLRTSMDRSTASGGWTVSGSGPASASPNAAITFPQLTSTSTGTVTFFSVGIASASTSGQIIASGTVSPNISCAQNVTPQLTTGSSVTMN